ncbi:MAG TPA: BTAD domain-containing putative transcriptional regulator [Pilimelia sp.]|nr:BTAD domain-containing putative transcriptional regulator [Pilimelia sp.]
MQVQVLGRLTAADDAGKPLPVEDLPRRARQVLGVLAARYDRVQSKDALADAVWGEDLPGNHVAALEHYVSVIRRTLHPGRPTSESFIVTRSGGYLFTTSRASLDLAELRALARLADSHAPRSPERLRLRQRVLDLAVDLPFGEEEYADWADAPRAEVRGAVLAALLELAEAARDTDPERALRLAREAIELDAYVEQPYRIAMRAAAVLGRADDALRWYDRCRRVLDEELGIQPSPETSQLRREILAARQAPATAAPADPVAPTDAGRRTALGSAVQAAPAPPVGTRARTPVGVPDGPSPRFLGRDQEIDLILAAQPVPVVHVVGPIGAGKTELVAELARRAPGRVGVGRGPGSAGALRLAWLRSALGQLGAPEAVLVAVDEAMADRRALSLEELGQVATVLDRRVPVVLAVDDAEDLDADSVTELAWLGQRCPMLCVTLTYRYPSQLTGRPVAALGAAVVLRLAPLAEEELEPAAEADLVERTGGIPALVAAVHRPPSVAASVAMHIARVRTRWMPEAGWEILRLCATLGSLRVGELAALTGLPLAEVLARVDQLVHAHLVAEGPGGHVRHRSGLIRDAVAEQVSTAHGMHLRERLAAIGA